MSSVKLHMKNAYYSHLCADKEIQNNIIEVLAMNPSNEALLFRFLTRADTS